MSVGRGMDKDVVHIYDGILLSHENLIMPCGNMEGLRDNHTKWNKLDKTIQISYGITHVESNFLNDINELIYKIEIDCLILKTNLQLPKGKHGGEG